MYYFKKKLKSYLDLGTILETEDEYICKVSVKKLNKLITCPSKTSIYSYEPCYIINENNTHVLEKPITYLFEGIKFNKPLYIDGASGNFIFERCTFGNVVSIKNVSSAKFYNNTHLGENQIDGNSFSCNNIENLEINSDKFPKNKMCSQYELEESTTIITNVQNVTLKNVVMSLGHLISKKALIDNSFLFGYFVYLNVDDLTYVKSSIKSNFLTINNKNNNVISNINSNVLEVNKIIYGTVYDYYLNEKNGDYLSVMKSVIDKLKLIKLSIEKIRYEKLNEVNEKINNDVVKRVLKK